MDNDSENEVDNTGGSDEFQDIEDSLSEVIDRPEENILANAPDIPGVQPIPQLNPPAAAMVVVITPEEVGLREEITGLIEMATTLYTRENPPPQYSKARKFLETVPLKLAELQKQAVKRISKQANPEVRTEHRKDWADTMLKFEDDLEAALQGLARAHPVVNPDVTAHKAEVDKFQAAVTHALKAVDDAVKQLDTDITEKTRDDQQLSMAMLNLFQQRITEIKKLIRPDLHKAYQDLIQFDTDKATEHGIEYNQNIAAKDKLVNDVFMTLASKPVDENSFGAPVGHSTPLNMSLVNGSIQSTLSRTSGSRGYDYRKGDPPDFNGTYVKYPAWREEMMNDVCQGKGPAAQVRLLAEHSPCKNLPDLFGSDVQKAWEYMNDKFCNPSMVSGEVTLAFLSKKNLRGSNDQQKLVNLFETVKELHNNLQLVNELAQLRDIPSMQLQIIKLTPLQYRQDLTKHLDSLAAQKPAGERLTPAENYAGISDWLEKNHRHLIVHCQDALSYRPPPPPGGGGDSRNKQGGARRGGGGGGGGHHKTGIHVHDAKKQKGSSRYGDCSADVPADQLATIKEDWKRLGKCKVCDAEGHMYEGGKDGGKWAASDSLADCPKFFKMDVEARASLVLHRKFCCKCLSTVHDTASCGKKKERWYCRVKKPNGDYCKAPHSNYLHGTKQKLLCHITTTFDMSRWSPTPEDDVESQEIINRDVMLPVVTVHLTKTISANILLDGGSQSSLITHKLAALMNLKAHSAVYEVRVVGHQPEIKQLKYYCLTIRDNKGKERKLVLLGLDEISEMPARYDVSVAYSVFPHVPAGSLDRAAGQIDILVGNDNVDLLPGGGLGEDLVDQLRVFHIPFGPGRVLTGSHPQIRFNNPAVTQEARSWFSAQFLRTTFCAGLQTQEVQSFYEAEMMGYTLPPRCKKCMTCTSCTIQDPNRTVKAQMELNAMRDNIWHDPATNTVTASYPTTGDINLFKDNRFQAIKRAELGANIDQQLAVQLIKMSYVDDGLFGGSEDDVRRMRGNLTITEKGTHQYDGTITAMLRLIGCAPKGICISGETDPKVLEKQGRVLGLVWHPTEDTIAFKVSINLSSKRGAGRTGPDLDPMKDRDTIMSTVFTRRICLQVAAQNFDPIGLISCFTVKFKIMMREVIARELKWDDPLPEDLQRQWRELVLHVLTLPEITFPRSITVSNAVGRPELIVYTDGSTVAFGAVVYVRWRLDPEEPQYHVALVTSKSRVTPKAGMTPPRSELQALVIAYRLAARVISAWTIRPVRLTVLTDSQCSVAAVDDNASALATFFSNRVLEIQTTAAELGPRALVPASQPLSQADLQALADIKQAEDEDRTAVDLLQHTPGLHNPADWPTRGNVEWEDLGPGRTWQEGPAYLKQERKDWIMSREFVREGLPVERKKKFAEALGVEPPAMAVLHYKAVQHGAATGYLRKAEAAMSYTNSFALARGIMARFVAFWDNKARTGVVDELVMYGVPSGRNIAEATWFFALAAMGQLRDELTKKGNRSALDIFWRHGVARTRGRLPPEDMMATMGYDSLVVLPASSRLAELLIISAHREDHRAQDGLVRVRRMGYWVIRGRRLLAKVTFAKWWRMWYDQVWQSLLPVNKWKETKANLAIGDLVLLKYSNKYSAPQYRYAVILKVHPDTHGVVRDVTIGVHSRRLREAKEVYSGSQLEEMLVPVQRCTLLLAKADQHTLEPADPDLHICEAGLRLPAIKDSFKSSPTGPTDPETPYSPGPTVETPSVELDETQPLPECDVTVPLDLDQARLHMFGVRSIHHLGAQKCEVTCWECSTRLQIRDCERLSVTPKKGKKISRQIN